MQEIRIDRLITVSNGQSNLVVDLSTRRKSTFTSALPLIEEFIKSLLVDNNQVRQVSRMKIIYAIFLLSKLKIRIAIDDLK